MKQTIVITGASSGIGKAAAKLFAERGWNVAATMRNPEKESELQMFSNIKVYALDVTIDFKQIDVLLNNAGYGLAGPLETASEEKILDQFNTNLFGAIRTIKAVLPSFREIGHGTIINITSIGGLVGLPFNSIYHATKFGLDGMSESLNYELRPFNIKVKTVAPGGVITDFAGRSLKRTVDGPSIYDEDIQKVFHSFSKNVSNYSTAEQIAEVIYTAATDGSNQIRYVAGEDAKQTYSKWKSMNNEDFFEMINDRYGLGGSE